MWVQIRILENYYYTSCKGRLNVPDSDSLILLKMSFLVSVHLSIVFAEKHKQSTIRLWLSPRVYSSPHRPGSLRSARPWSDLRGRLLTGLGGGRPSSSLLFHKVALSHHCYCRRYFRSISPRVAVTCELSDIIFLLCISFLTNKLPAFYTGSISFHLQHYLVSQSGMSSVSITFVLFQLQLGSMSLRYEWVSF